MKKIIVVFTLTFFYLFALAQAPSANENALLWRISGNGLRHIAYVYGTIHLIPRNDFFLTDSTLQALAQSESVAFEFNLKKEMRLLPQLRLFSKMRMKGDTTLEMLLNEEDYTFVKLKFQQKRLPLKFLQRIKPSFISDLASNDMGAAKKNEMTSYEMELLQRAKDQNKSIDGLETAAYQLGVFDAIPYSVQAQMLVDELRSDGESGSKQYKKLVKIYKRQDLQALSKIMYSGDEMSQYNEILLDKRNRNWIPVMERQMAKKRMFFAVGAGHLIGEQGVVSLLRKRGFTLTPIR